MVSPTSLLESPSTRTSKLASHISALHLDPREKIKPSGRHGHQTGPLHALQIHLWEADDSYYSPRHDSQMETGSARICHHRLHARAPRSSCKGVLWARKYTRGETVVLSFSGKGGGRRRGALTNVWCMLLWRQQRSESSGLSVTDHPDKSSTPQPLSPGLIHSSAEPSPPCVAFEKLWDMMLAFKADWGLFQADLINTYPEFNKWGLFSRCCKVLIRKSINLIKGKRAHARLLQYLTPVHVSCAALYYTRFILGVLCAETRQGLHS